MTCNDFKANPSSCRVECCSFIEEKLTKGNNSKLNIAIVLILMHQVSSIPKSENNMSNGCGGYYYTTYYWIEKLIKGEMDLLRGACQSLTSE